MTTFEQWDVALAHFPFSESRRSKLRPIVVLSTALCNQPHGVMIATMITSAAEGRWSSDHEIIDLPAAGLKRSCVVRCKVATLSRSLVGRSIGALADVDRGYVSNQLSAILPIGPAA